MATGPPDLPHGWAALRRLVLFVLGCAVIIDAVVGSPQHLGQLIVGLLLVGLVPVDELLGAITRPFRWRRDQDGPAD